MKRPTHKELSHKIVEAKNALEQRRIAILKPEVLACDASELGYLIERDLFDVLAGLLNELTPGHYAGSHPPSRSYEDIITGTDLIAFRFESLVLKSLVYFKFAIYDGTFWIVSLHNNRG